MEMELREIHDRFCKLEEILIQLAKWTNFDIHKFSTANNSNNTTSNVSDLEKTVDADACHDHEYEGTIEATLNTDHADLKDDLVNQSHPTPTDVCPDVEVGDEKVIAGSGSSVGVDVGADFGGGNDNTDMHNESFVVDVDVDMVYKIEVDYNSVEDVDVDAAVGEFSSNSPSKKNVPMDNLRLNVPVPCFTCTPPKPYKADSELGSKAIMKRRRHRRGRGQHSRSVKNKEDKITKLTVIPFNSVDLPNPFVRMEKLTSRQVLSQIKKAMAMHSINTNANTNNTDASYITPKSVNPESESSRDQPRANWNFNRHRHLRAKLPIHQLNRHVLLVHQKRNHKCSLCPYEAMSKNMLQKHVREIHPRVGAKNQNQCPQCPQLFKTLDKLQQHPRAHTGEKPFKCKKYPYVTPHQANFIKHNRKLCKGRKRKGLETLESVLFSCDECGRQFTNVGNVNRHKSKWHPSKSEDILKCSHCNLHFNDKKLLDLHMRKRHEGEKSAPIPMSQDKANKAAEEFKVSFN